MKRDQGTTVMGQDISMPVVISPTGVQAVHPDVHAGVVPPPLRLQPLPELDGLPPGDLLPDVEQHLGGDAQRLPARGVGHTRSHAELAEVALSEQLGVSRGTVRAALSELAHAWRLQFRDTDPADWDRIIAVNLYGVMHCTQAVIDGMTMDLDRNRYLDFATLEHYCRSGAGRSAPQFGQL